MTDVTIRPATPDDRDVIVEFNLRLAEESEGKRLEADVLREGVAALLRDPARGRYFLACCDGRAVGQLMHTREWSDWRNGDLWWLQSVYVEPEHRRRGVFRALFNHLLAAARAAADPPVVGLRLYVEAANTRAHATYRDLGLHEAGYFVMEWIFHGGPTAPRTTET